MQISESLTLLSLGISLHGELMVMELPSLTGFSVLSLAYESLPSEALSSIGDLKNKLPHQVSLQRNQRDPNARSGLGNNF